MSFCSRLFARSGSAWLACGAMNTPAARTTSDVHAPSSNTAAVLTIPAGDVISGIAWSYSAAPTGGALTVANGTTTVFSVEITAGGPGFFTFDPPLIGSPGSSLTITLAAGGSGISGKLNLLGRWGR